MTREEAKEFIVQSVKSDVDIAKVADAIKALEQKDITWIVGNDNVQIAVRNMPVDMMQKICAIIGNEQEVSTKNDLAVDCISRKAALDITWQDPSYSDPLNVLTEVRDKIRELPSVTPQEPRVDFEELKRKILSEVDGGTDDAWLAYGEVCIRISNSIEEFVADMRGEEE